MASNTQKIGWIGMGRMGFPMAERLLTAGYDVSIWNRTRAKAEPLAAKGGKIVDHLSDLRHVDVLFSIVSTGKDLDQVLFRQEQRDRRRRQDARHLRRLLDHRGRGIGEDPRAAGAARQRVRGRAGERQCQGDQGRTVVGGALRPPTPPARR